MEGQRINRPLFFDGNNYNYLKCRMIIYLKSINLDLWNIVVNAINQENVEADLCEIAPEVEAT